MVAANANENVRYEPNENPPLPLALGVGFQAAVVILAPVVLTVVTARADGGGAELEFVSGFEEENLEDQLSYLGEKPDIRDGREISFRLLRHYASSVRHQKYHGEDIVTVRVARAR